MYKNNLASSDRLFSLRHKVADTKLTKTNISVKIIDVNETKELSKSLCLVCSCSVSSYTCPRCLIAYCSSLCYNKHGKSCTEAFYKERVENELANMKVERNGTDVRSSGKAKETINDILLRSRNNMQPIEPNNDEHLPLFGISESRLAELLEAEKLGKLDFDLLSEIERKAFIRSLRTGSLSRFLNVWDPWWTCKSATGLIEEIEDVDNDHIESHSIDEADLEQLAHFDCKRHSKKSLLMNAKSSLEKLEKLPFVSASTNLPHIVLDIVLAYATMIRMYNGCWCADPIQASYDLLELSAALSSKVEYLHIEDALESNWIKQDHIFQRRNYSTREQVHSLNDAIAIISSSLYTHAVFLELIALFSEVKRHAKKKEKSLFYILKRLEYFELWAVSEKGLKAMEEECILLLECIVSRSNV